MSRLPAWECFPPFGDRVWHGYRWDPEADAFVSLCGRRSVEDSDHDPRRRYLSKRGGKKGDQPDPVDTSSYCQKCCQKAHRRPRRSPSRTSTPSRTHHV